MTYDRPPLKSLKINDNKYAVVKHKNIFEKEGYISKKKKKKRNDGTIATTNFLMCNVLLIL
jgi:hypothetical protein